jgi:hypothetical protein
MRFTRLALIGIMAAAIFIIGCSSNKDTASGPIYRSLAEDVHTSMVKTYGDGQPNNQADVAPLPRIGVTGIIHKTEDVGCSWYIESAGGETYVPVFDKEPDLTEGSHIYIYGFVDTGSVAECYKVPFFYVDKYELALSCLEESGIITLTGVLLQGESGDKCAYIITDDKTEYELDFGDSRKAEVNSVLKWGSYVTVTGVEEVGIIGKCINGPVFEVHKLSYVDNQ